jgi:hypothetical protein
MPQYMMILHDSMAAFEGISPDEMQRILARYQAWSAKTGQAGHLVGGQKLRDEGGRNITRANGKMVVRDGPFAEAREVIGGYFLIEAPDYDAAVRICSDCPHLDLGGRIELREVEVM